MMVEGQTVGRMITLRSNTLKHFKGTDVLLVHCSSSFGSFVAIGNFDLIYGLSSTHRIILDKMMIDKELNECRRATCI